MVSGFWQTVVHEPKTYNILILSDGCPPEAARSRVKEQQKTALETSTSEGHFTGTYHYSVQSIELQIDPQWLAKKKKTAAGSVPFGRVSDAALCSRERGRTSTGSVN